jgi:hypothetical protein
MVKKECCYTCVYSYLDPQYVMAVCLSGFVVGTRQENLRNAAKRRGTSSRFKGVSHRKDRDIWSAGIGISGEHKSLGCYDDEVEAARAYDRAAVEYFGEFARLNFPDEWPPERRQEVYAQRDAAKAEGEKAGGSGGKRRRTKDRASRRDGTKKEGKKVGRKKGKTDGTLRRTSARRKTPGAPPRTTRAARRATKKPTAQRTTHDAKRTTNSRRATGHRSRAARPKTKGSRRTGSTERKTRAGRPRHARARAPKA